MENRQSRVLVALSAVLTLLVLAIVLLDPPPPDKEESRTWTRAFPNVTEDAVTQVRLKMRDREVVIEQVDGQWRWTEPVSAPADPTQVDSLISSMLFVDIGAALPDVDPASVGLTAPAAVIRLTTATGEISLALGDDAPVGSSSYVQLEDGSVRPTRTRTSAALPSSIDTLRSRGLVVFPRGEVSELIIDSPHIAPEAALHIRRELSGDWLEGTSPRLRADRTRVDTLIDALRYAEGEQFLDDASPLVDGWTVRIGHSDPTEWTELTLAEGIDGVWRGSGPRQPGQAVLMASELPELLTGAQSGWVDRHLITLRYTQLDRIEAVLDGRSMDARRTADGWDDPRAEAVLVALEAGTAQRGAPAPSAVGEPTGRITAHHGDASVELTLYQGLGDGGRAGQESGTDAPLAVYRGTLQALAEALTP